MHRPDAYYSNSYSRGIRWLPSPEVCRMLMEFISIRYKSIDFLPAVVPDCFNSFQQMLDSSQLKEFADDNFKFHENGIKFSKKLENTVRKGEIARNEQFLFFPQCFQKTCTADTYLRGT